MVKNTQTKTKLYKILIEGHLDKKIFDWLKGDVVEVIYTSRPEFQTSMVVDVPDQAALRGIMTKLWDLNLSMISISMLE